MATNVPEPVFEILVYQSGKKIRTEKMNNSMGRLNITAIGRPFRIFSETVRSFSLTFSQRTMNCFSFSDSIMQN